MNFVDNVYGNTLYIYTYLYQDIFTYNFLIIPSPLASLQTLRNALNRHSIFFRFAERFSSSRYQIRATVSFRGTRAPHISSLLAVVKTDYAIESGGERRRVEMREMLELERRGGWIGMDIPPVERFYRSGRGIYSRDGCSPGQIHQQLDLLGRWINLSIHGRRSTDGVLPHREKIRSSPIVKLFSLPLLPLLLLLHLSKFRPVSFYDNIDLLMRVIRDLFWNTDYRTVSFLLVSSISGFDL